MLWSRYNSLLIYCSYNIFSVRLFSIKVARQARQLYGNDGKYFQTISSTQEGSLRRVFAGSFLTLNIERFLSLNYPFWAKSYSHAFLQGTTELIAKRFRKLGGCVGEQIHNINPLRGSMRLNDD